MTSSDAGQVGDVDGSGIDIVRLEPRDESADGRRLWAGWYELTNAEAVRVAGEDANVWDGESERRGILSSKNDIRLYAAVRAGELVAAGRFFRRTTDTPQDVFLDVTVPPGLRGQGIGRALLAGLEDEARAAGCAEALAELSVPSRGDAAEGSRAVEFASDAGYVEFQRSVCQVLPLPLPPGFGDGVGPVPGYRIETCTGEPPAAWREGLAHLKRRMSTDAPPGERPAVEQVWDAERVREHYARYLELGETLVLAVAIHEAGGELAGYTDTSWVPDLPHVIHQGDTLVAREHRGHGLGLALKTASLSAIVPLVPSGRVHRTSNAVENTWMRAINARLGYVPDFEIVAMRKVL